MLTKQRMQKHSEGESWDKQKSKSKRKTHSKHSEEKLLPKCEKNLQLLSSIGLQDKVCYALGLWRHSHKGLTTALSRRKTIEKFQSQRRGLAGLDIREYPSLASAHSRLC